MERDILYKVLTLVLVIVIIYAFFIVNAGGKIITPFQNSTEIRTICEFWECEEPIPPEITENLECINIEECKSACEKIGAIMLRCIY